MLQQHAMQLQQVAVFAAPTLFLSLGDLTWTAQVVQLCAAQMAWVSAWAVGLLACKCSCVWPGFGLVRAASRRQAEPTPSSCAQGRLPFSGGAVLSDLGAAVGSLLECLTPEDHGPEWSPRAEQACRRLLCLCGP